MIVAQAGPASYKLANIDDPDTVIGTYHASSINPILDLGKNCQSRSNPYGRGDALERINKKAKSERTEPAAATPAPRSRVSPKTRPGFARSRLRTVAQVRVPWQVLAPRGADPSPIMEPPRGTKKPPKETAEPKAASSTKSRRRSTSGASGDRLGHSEGSGVSEKATSQRGRETGAPRTPSSIPRTSPPRLTPAVARAEPISLAQRTGKRDIDISQTPVAPPTSRGPRLVMSQRYHSESRSDPEPHTPATRPLCEILASYEEPSTSAAQTHHPASTHGMVGTQGKLGTELRTPAARPMLSDAPSSRWSPRAVAQFGPLQGASLQLPDLPSHRKPSWSPTKF
ncbi:uncharacterized protein LOC128199745 [Bicyclus anynana]|uniref:Uncharacterized protein LOC128199745 n=1 Tax=Bicyclus anynana TaxID=110368 RepID=A0ABM3M5U0_BICAN|nr:uncharacterized protein LOC128199745 [Bicyclus anynana]